MKQKFLLEVEARPGYELDAEWVARAILNHQQGLFVCHGDIKVTEIRTPINFSDASSTSNPTDEPPNTPRR